MGDNLTGVRLQVHIPRDLRQWPVLQGNCPPPLDLVQSDGHRGPAPGRPHPAHSVLPCPRPRPAQRPSDPHRPLWGGLLAGASEHTPPLQIVSLLAPPSGKWRVPAVQGSLGNRPLLLPPGHRSLHSSHVGLRQPTLARAWSALLAGCPSQAAEEEHTPPHQEPEAVLAGVSPSCQVPRFVCVAVFPTRRRDHALHCEGSCWREGSRHK